VPIPRAEKKVLRQCRTAALPNPLGDHCRDPRFLSSMRGQGLSKFRGSATEALDLIEGQMFQIGRAYSSARNPSIPRRTSSVTPQCQSHFRNGSIRSLLTNIADPSASVNVNHVRSKRQVVKGVRADTTEVTGGSCFSAHALVDNW